MIDVSGLNLSLDAGLPENHTLAIREVAKQLGVKTDAIRSAQLMKRSVDARKKSQVHFIATYHLELTPEVESRMLRQSQQKDSQLKGLQVRYAHPYEPIEIIELSSPEQAPVVVGAGPAGLFAAWYLAKCGLEPLVIEQGAPVEERMRDVRRFFQTGVLDPCSNVQFGEGGAGTFSDGKLTTNLKNRYTAHVLHWFVDAGAPESILWQAHPHLGSDNLASIVANIRKDIIRLGGEVRFHTKLTDIVLEDGSVRSIELEDTKTGRSSKQYCSELILACGHSARQTFELVRDRGFAMEQKPFSMGVRIEHPQALINEAQWGSAAQHPALEAAEYKIAIHLPSGRSVYSFCMCPGGEVVAAASEAGGIVTNGMSDHARAGKNANAALLVNVDPSDLENDDVLAGVKLQREVEQRAYQVSQRFGGAPYQAPAQRLEAFLRGSEALFEGSSIFETPRGEFGAIRETGTKDQRSFCVPTYERGVIEAPIDEVLPEFITQALREAIPRMGKKIKGFDRPEAVLTAPETRSSSPVRICRDESLQAFVSSENGSAEQTIGTGLYPCGEGPGFAGGIMSAAIDGLKVAQTIALKHQEKAGICQRSDRTRSNGGIETDAFSAVVDALRSGKPAIFPTDTVYGLGVAVENASSPKQLYQLKQRSNDKPIAWLVGSASDLEIYGKNISLQARALARKHWPGALTLVVEASDAVPWAYRSQAGTIALRMPNHSAVLALIDQVGPLATTSANYSGDPAPICLAEVPEQLQAEVQVLAGEVYGRSASSVLDCTSEAPRIIRQGAIEFGELSS